MNISDAGLMLIEGFEGFVSPAGPDPVGIPTIGFGTTVYSDGRIVRNGDTISQVDAEVELKFACDRIAATIEERLPSSISLNQNQVDALVSFTYNVGIAALLKSTLFKERTEGNFSLAADEFENWVHATRPDGEKITLPGLVDRRAKERDLFLKPDDGTTKPLPPNTSEADTIVKAVGFRSAGSGGNRTNIVASFNKDGATVEIVEIVGNSPETLIALLETYPKLADFEFAEPNAAAPTGDRKLFSDVSSGLTPSGPPPVLHRALLSIGRAQDDNAPVDDVKTMQRRLGDLNYYDGSIDGLFGPQTDRAVKDFQAKYFGPAEADGLVGPKTWAKLFGDAAPFTPPPGDQGSFTAGDNFLKLTRSGALDEFRAEVLILSNFVDGKFDASLKVRSGLPHNQSFRLKPESIPGSEEPLPQCEYAINEIKWSGRPNDFSAPAFNSGTGPVFVPLEPVKPKLTRRDGFEIHIDWNRYPFSPGAANGRSAPGTAGCIGLLSVADYKILVSWLNSNKPQRLVVDWGIQ